VIKLREAEVSRKTKETDIRVNVQLEGNGNIKVDTSIKFLDHIITSFATHSLIDIQIEATGDLIHHTAEDVALTLGEAINKALGDRKGIKRFGFAMVPMDDALSYSAIDLVKNLEDAAAYSAVDLVKRPFQVADLKIDKEGIEDMAAEDIYHFIQSFSQSLQANIHVIVKYGNNDHHKVESAIKCIALAIRNAISTDNNRTGTPSSKGVM
jgi:imidazoleglycerol-phosphate dehydratase|tara:strand:- start:10909 stop:11538 length:630 start_codon:yes stop_codon:yes gene_type:complete